MTTPYRSYTTVDPAITEWAVEAARSTILVRRISKVCFGLAAVALALGIVAAVAVYLAYSDADTFGGGPGSLGVAQAANMLTTALLPAGLLTAAGAVLRLQAVRFETELYEAGDDAAEADAEAAEAGEPADDITT